MIDEYEYFKLQLKTTLENLYGGAIDAILIRDTDIHETNIKRGYVVALQDIIGAVRDIEEKIKEMKNNDND